MKITLIEAGLIKALSGSLCPKTNIDILYKDYEIKVLELTNSFCIQPIEKIRELDCVLCELAAIRACITQKKYALLHN